MDKLRKECKQEIKKTKPPIPAPPKDRIMREDGLFCTPKK